MSNIKLNSGNTQRRIKFQLENPGKKATCACGKIALIFDPENIGEGFPIGYSSTKRLYLTATCLSCQNATQKMHAAIKRGDCIAPKPATVMAGIKRGWGELTNNSKICLRCDKIQSGKNKVCNVCGKSSAFSSGNKLAQTGTPKDMCKKTDVK